VTDPTKEYMMAVVPLGWMRCTCGEKLECPETCDRFLDAKQQSHEYLQQMFEALVGS
jgi:hypothetical protein